MELPPVSYQILDKLRNFSKASVSLPRKWYNSCVKYLLRTSTKKIWGEPEWLSQLSIRLSISAQVMISWFVRSSPVLGSALGSTLGMEPAWDSLSLLLPLPLPCISSHALPFKKYKKVITYYISQKGMSRTAKSEYWLSTYSLIYLINIWVSGTGPDIVGNNKVK